MNEHGDNLKNGISQNDSDSNDDESDWEVSDFTSSENSCDEWLLSKECHMGVKTTHLYSMDVIRNAH